MEIVHEFRLRWVGAFGKRAEGHKCVEAGGCNLQPIMVQRSTDVSCSSKSSSKENDWDETSSSNCLGILGHFNDLTIGHDGPILLFCISESSPHLGLRISQ